MTDGQDNNRKPVDLWLGCQNKRASDEVDQELAVASEGLLDDPVKKQAHLVRLSYE